MSHVASPCLRTVREQAPEIRRAVHDLGRATDLNLDLRVDGLVGLGVTVAADMIEVLERETRRIDQDMATDAHSIPTG